MYNFHVIQHKKVGKIFGAKRENELTLQPQKRKRGTLRGIFAKFIAAVRERKSSLKELKKQV